MKIELIEVQREKRELFFDIVDAITKIKIGILFTIDNHIAYEIKEEFRGKGAATEALRLITSRIKNPTLEIANNNIASKKVALKSGYVLVKQQLTLEIYKYSSESNKKMA